MPVSIGIFSASFDKLGLSDFRGYCPQGSGTRLKTGLAPVMRESRAVAATR